MNRQTWEDMESLKFLQRGEGDESASALNRTAKCGHTVVIISEVMDVVMCLGEMCNLEENKRKHFPDGFY